MASSYEIRLVAIKIKNAYDMIETGNNQTVSRLQEVPNWWQGRASEAFMSELSGITKNVNSYLKTLDKLYLKLNRLADKIDEWEALKAAAAEEQEE